jgi:hypothetical protein
MFSVFRTVVNSDGRFQDGVVGVARVAMSFFRTSKSTHGIEKVGAAASNAALENPLSNVVTAVRPKEAETNAVERLRNLVGREAQADRQSEGRDQQT